MLVTAPPLMPNSKAILSLSTPSSHCCITADFKDSEIWQAYCTFNKNNVLLIVRQTRQLTRQNGGQMRQECSTHLLQDKGIGGNTVQFPNQQKASAAP
jgi:hypothetical protein